MKDFDYLKKIMNAWDPMGLLYMGAPRDEYYPEIRTIQERLKDSLSVAELADVIKQVFVKAFDEKSFSYVEADCEKVAQMILYAIRYHPDVEAEFRMNGARRTPAADGYRPDHAVASDYLASGTHHYYGQSSIESDGTAIGTITFLTPEAYPHCLHVGQGISVQEGSLVVGTAVIRFIYNPGLDRDYRKYRKHLPS